MAISKRYEAMRKRIHEKYERKTKFVDTDCFRGVKFGDKLMLPNILVESESKRKKMPPKFQAEVIGFNKKAEKYFIAVGSDHFDVYRDKYSVECKDSLLLSTCKKGCENKLLLWISFDDYKKYLDM